MIRVEGGAFEALDFLHSPAEGVRPRRIVINVFQKSGAHDIVIGNQKIGPYLQPASAVPCVDAQ